VKEVAPEKENENKRPRQIEAGGNKRWQQIEPEIWAETANSMPGRRRSLYSVESLEHAYQGQQPAVDNQENIQEEPRWPP
jgi:hypothetical protein